MIFICKRQPLTFLCSFDNKLKMYPKYLNHHVNRRCDDLIAILLFFHMYHHCKYLDIRNSSDLLSLKHDGMDHHNKAVGILDGDVKVKLQLSHKLFTYISFAYKESDNVFKVNLSDCKQVYTVYIKGATCSIDSCCISVQFLSMDTCVVIE